VDDNSGDEESEIEEKIYQAGALGKEKKICPYCGEEILAIAVKCRYCRSDLIEPKPSPAPASDLAGLDQRIDQTDLLVDMDNYGVAPDPKPIPEGIVDFRSTVWITSILIILGCIALGISYLSK
jgi:ribosomal protein L40E